MKFLAGLVVGALIGVTCTVAYYEWWDVETDDAVVAGPELPEGGDAPREPARK